MKIIIAIHLPSTWFDNKLPVFLKSQFQQDSKTFFFCFLFLSQDKEFLASIAKKFSKFEKNFVPIEPKLKAVPGWTEADFMPYRESFLKALGPLKGKCGKKEKIEVISFGGAADVCYKKISLPVHKELARLFGQEKLIAQRTYLPLVYAKPCPKKTVFKIPSLAKRIIEIIKRLKRKA